MRVWAGLFVLTAAVCGCAVNPGFATREHESLTIVSDVDDTVKLTHVSCPAAALINGLFTSATFPGMAELYTELLRNGPASSDGRPQLFFVSGSPRFLGCRVESLVHDGGFPPSEIRLKDRWPFRATPDLKLDELARIAAATGGPMLLFGDDTEQDPETLTEFAAIEHGDRRRVAAIYIHTVTGHVCASVAPWVTRYYTAFDVAVAEADAHRLSAAAAARIGEAVRHHLDLAFPSFACCPRQPPDYASHPSVQGDHELSEEADRMSVLIRTTCAKRSSACDVDPAPKASGVSAPAPAT